SRTVTRTRLDRILSSSAFLHWVTSVELVTTTYEYDFGAFLLHRARAAAKASARSPAGNAATKHTSITFVNAATPFCAAHLAALIMRKATTALRCSAGLDGPCDVALLTKGIALKRLHDFSMSCKYALH